MDELKVCPFCGGKFLPTRHSYKEDIDGDGVEETITHFGFTCGMCHIETSFYETEKEAAEAVNRRAEPENKCVNCGTDLGPVYCPKCYKAEHEEPENKPLTVGDHFRSLTNEELADLLIDAEGAGYNDNSIAPKDDHGYSIDMLDWLNQPYAHKPEQEEK